MNSRTLTIILCAALLLSVRAFQAAPKAARYPGDNQGYAPAQPIAFSHQLHAGTLEISCLYCHAGAERSRVAGLPPVQTCLNCHQFVKGHAGGGASPQLQKLYDAVKPVEWVKVHDLPAFVHFDHSAHVLEGVSCVTCHGQVKDMVRMTQAKTLSMGMCIQCHRAANTNGINGRKVNATLDCSGCHY